MLLHCDYKPGHAENHKFRMFKCGKLDKSYGLTKCGYRYKCEVKTLTVEVVMCLSSMGTHVPLENATIRHGQGEDYSDQSSFVSSTVQDDWVEQVWLAGNDNSESCKEYSESECPVTDSDSASCDDLEVHMGEPTRCDITERGKYGHGVLVLVLGKAI